MQLRGALLAASLLALPIAASAQPVTGLYVSGGIGLNLMQGENIDSVTFPNGDVSGVGKLQSHPQIAGVLAAGWGLGNGLRFEGEFAYRSNKFNTLSQGGTDVASAGGTEQKFGPMVNVLYDFVGIPVVQPYVGLGIGYQWANEQNTTVYGGSDSASLNTDSKGAFAYQAILGVALPIAAAPGLAVTAEYRFMGLAGNRNYSGVASSTGFASVPIGVKLNDDYNHTFLLGIRYNFGQAPVVAAAATAAAPAPAVAPARSYLVFFDWDKATLTDRARQIIKEAADNSTHVQYTRIEVNGYTDTSGTPQYNMGLSIRRATVVKAELIKDGVPAAAISTQGFGETHLLVPTGPGVREPQNRRVEIIIH